MKANPIKFGTDGWRGLIARDFTFDNVRVCAQAVADYFREAGLADRGLLIGYDTRFASEDFAAAAAEVTAANGIKTLLCRRAVPTPVVSFGVIRQQVAGAIIITASHNPGAWNGFKVKTSDGASAATPIVARIQEIIDLIFASGGIKQMALEEALQRKMVEHIDLMPPYLEHIGRLVDLERLRQSRLKVVIDPMFGAGMGYLRVLLQGGTLEAMEINGERNPIFPGTRPEPIAVNLAKLSATVRKEGASVGLATDGDADRVGIIGEDGTFLTQLEVFALLCLYLLEMRGERGAIVKTTTSSSMLYRLGEIYQVPVYETPVGFKYVAPIMIKENALIGGEESGGFGFRGHVPDRDGVLAALYFLDMMARTGKTPSQLREYLFSRVGPHHYTRVDIEFPADKRPAIIKRVSENPPLSLDGVKVAKADQTDGFRYILSDGSWLLVRFSGTEPLLRIYAESDSSTRAERLLALGRELAGV